MKAYSTLVLAVLSTPAFGQQLAEVDVIRTLPTNVFASESFQIIAEGTFLSCFSPNQDVIVAGNTIQINLDLRVSPNCSPIAVFQYSFVLPGIPVGEYTIEIFENTSNIGISPRAVSGLVVRPRVVPSLGAVSSIILAVLLCFAGMRRLSYNMALKEGPPGRCAPRATTAPKLDVRLPVNALCG